MVLLTMTPSIVEGLSKWKPSTGDTELPGDATPAEQHGEPTLDEPAVGKPISHGQVVDLWKKLQQADEKGYTLESLLCGARVYVPLPPPKPEPVRTYFAYSITCRPNPDLLLTCTC
jgi:hypothetical protein